MSFQFFVYSKRGTLKALNSLISGSRPFWPHFPKRAQRLHDPLGVRPKKTSKNCKKLPAISCVYRLVCAIKFPENFPLDNSPHGYIFSSRMVCSREARGDTPSTLTLQPLAFLEKSKGNPGKKQGFFSSRNP